MRCPRCYGKINKTTKTCNSCGFSLKEFVGATNQKAKKAFKEHKGEDVYYTNILPIDLEKKKMLLFCGFLGYAGLHNFYCGKYFKAFYSVISFVLVSFFTCFKMLRISTTFLEWGYSFSALFMGINIIMWISDFISICFNNYNVPVYKDEYSIKK